MLIDPSGNPFDPLTLPIPQGRALVPYQPAPLPTAPPAQPPAEGKAVAGGAHGVDTRHLAPCRIGELSMDLYISGNLGWEEYSMLAFQAELPPAFNQTIGALTGEKAEPDRPRDYVALWEERLAFEQKNNAQDRALVGRTQRILNVLNHMDTPTDIMV
ncbi:MAG TPA: hypothetical protein QF509_05500 [Rhodospirillales bacterium]|jgi:hypothetical protein|nr:hypothetical protein [Rhodospirillales bacterium]